MSPALRVHDLKLEALGACVDCTAAKVTVKLQGNADMSSHAPFRDFIAELHGETVRLGAPILELDLTELYFMNSSCLSILAGLINNVSSSPPSSQYRIVLRTNPHLRWQKRSVHALCMFANHLVTAV
jgi:hypothetical protein